MLYRAHPCWRCGNFSEEVVELAEEVRDRTAAATVPLTFFEFVTVMGFVHFARQKVDVAVVEVGLGGRLDATNLVKPLVSVITTISKDHEAYLGSDLLSIAREKGGIIKPGVPLVADALPKEAVNLFNDLARERRAPAYFLGQDYRIFLKNAGLFDYTGVKEKFEMLSVALRGRHQRSNAAVALASLETARETVPVIEEVLREGPRTAKWPGRFEIMPEFPTVIWDGPHTGRSAKTP